MTSHDAVNSPSHYTSHPSGVECIEVTEQLGFRLGNAAKYLWRRHEKDNYDEQLGKASWYIIREIESRSREWVWTGPFRWLSIVWHKSLTRKVDAWLQAEPDSDVKAAFALIAMARFSSGTAELYAALRLLGEANGA